MSEFDCETDNETIEKTAKEIWNELTYTQKLAATSVVFDKLAEHSEKSGTFRYLIYDRLGFNSNAYSELYRSGMYLSNLFSEVSNNE